MENGMPLNPGNVCAGLEVVPVQSEDLFGDMYQLQVDLQKRLGCLPVEPRDAKVATAKILYWKHCVDDEIEELLEWCTGPKVFSTDMLKEIQMEAIDIVHFVFNIGIELDMYPADIRLFEGYMTYIYDDSYIDKRVLKESCEKLRRSIIDLIRLMPWKTWKTYPELDFARLRKNVLVQYGNVFTYTLELCLSSGMNRETVAATYFAKNKENHRRQDNGY